VKSARWLNALALALVLFGLPAGQSLTVRADPGSLYVATDGDDSRLCNSIANRCRTVQRAVDLATTDDIIKVSAGLHRDADTPSLGYVVALTKTITLRGGYNSAFAEPPSPDAHRTILDAQGQGRVIYITGRGIAPTVEGFTITGGDASGLGGSEEGRQDAGGGIYCDWAGPIIADNIIIDNIASTSSDRAYGGGIHLETCRQAQVRDNTISSNTANSSDRGLGGGICLQYSDATITGNTIINNTGSTAASSGGGGLYAYQSDALISDNTVEGNVASTVRAGEGGGIRIQYGIVTLRSNTVRGNIAQAPDKGAGGGVSVSYGDELTLDSNLIIGNVAHDGSGIAIGQGSTFTLTNNIIVRNRSGYLGGGLLLSARDTYPSAGTLLHNTIADNAGISSEGVYIRNYVTLNLVNNIVSGHGVGITNSDPANSTVTADHTLFEGNDTDYGSGVTSINEVHGNPDFVARAAGDYHLLSGSMAIDSGMNAGVADDIDGDPRPLVSGYDIGADEWNPSKPTPTPTATPTRTPTPTPTPSVTPTSTPAAVEWRLYLPLLLRRFAA